MDISESVTMTVKTLSKNRLRSLLTVLEIIIDNPSGIARGGIGQGAQRYTIVASKIPNPKMPNNSNQPKNVEMTNFTQALYDALELAMALNQLYRRCCCCWRKLSMGDRSAPGKLRLRNFAFVNEKPT